MISHRDAISWASTSVGLVLGPGKTDTGMGRRVFFLFQYLESIHNDIFKNIYCMLDETMYCTPQKDSFASKVIFFFFFGI